MITNKRYDYIDCIGGLLILHMIAFHIFQAGRSGLAASAMRPLSFFMFWFFFKSGVFYKPQMSHAIFYKGFYKLLVPYLIFSVLGYMLWLFRQILVSGYNLQTCVIEPIEELLSTGSLPGNVALWFLPSLLIVHLLFNFVKMGGVNQA